MMAWIESHQELDEHPKTRKAAALLGVSVPTVIGHLHILWHWALSYAQDGDLTDFDASDIALAARWDGNAEQFVTALIDCRLGTKRAGFLDRTADGRLVIHDWWEYGGKLVAKRSADAERKRSERAKDVPQMSVGHPADGAGRVQYSTVQDNTLDNRTEDSRLKEVVGRPTPTPAPDPLFEAFQQARGGAVNALDAQQVADLAALYGTDTTIRAIQWCNSHRKQPFLSIGYLGKTLSGWQQNGIPAPPSNGKQPEVKPKRVVLPDGREVDA